MDTLAYNHFTLARETETPAIALDWKKLSSHNLMALLSLTLAVGAVSTLAPEPAAAHPHHGHHHRHHGGGGGGSTFILDIGMSGPAVAQLQRRLSNLGYFNAGITGYFGPITQGAVYRFQRANGLSPDGVVGPITRSALYGGGGGGGCHRARCHHGGGGGGGRTLRPGMDNRRVVRLQARLRSYGYFNAYHNTGYYGPITTSGVMSFQRSNGLRVDGIAGPATLRALGM